MDQPFPAGLRLGVCLGVGLSLVLGDSFQRHIALVLGTGIFLGLGFGVGLLL